MSGEENKIRDGYTNSLGMKFLEIEPGSFYMGEEDGDLDEKPVHKVNITEPFYMGITEVTNEQYEKFDPEHEHLRGKRSFSEKDNEAVVFVSWFDAVKFCEWLSEKEGKTYRLPTEAEWEYACRAGTETRYFTGEELSSEFHKNQVKLRNPEPVEIKVGETPPNPWGLYDMHGNVEEWCHDWYGPYSGEMQDDPVGYAEGEYKVTRGGSHNTEVEFLRSANRLAMLPEDRNWLIGFRVVQGQLPETQPFSRREKKLWSLNVNQTPCEWSVRPIGGEPEFREPISFIKHSDNEEEIPLYRHNHCPSIAWCDNGDLLVAWFSCNSEDGREMTILRSRLRNGSDEWDEPAEFLKVPDRNMTGTSLYNDGNGRLLHFNGVDVSYGWKNLALVLRISIDNGVSWSKPQLINDEHALRNQVISGTIQTKEGYLIQPCDAVSTSSGGTAIHISRDGGKTWKDPGADRPNPEFVEGGTGNWIAGIHAGVVQLTDGGLLAYGRGNTIDGRMPRSVSNDMGRTWTYTASEFSVIGGGQRLILMRLQEGPILLVSFTDSKKKESKDPLEGILIMGQSGKKCRVYGMFAALSFDEGETWPVKKLITTGGPARESGTTNKRSFVMDETHAEPVGYLAATQSPDGLVHLVSSNLHYRFNLSWLREPMSI